MLSEAKEELYKLTVQEKMETELAVSECLRQKARLDDLTEKLLKWTEHVRICYKDRHELRYKKVIKHSGAEQAQS